MRYYKIIFCLLFLWVNINCANDKKNEQTSHEKDNISILLKSRNSTLEILTIEEIDSFYIKNDRIIGISLTEDAFKKLIEVDTGKIIYISIAFNNNEVYESKWTRVSGNILAALWSRPYYSRKNKKNYIALTSCKKDGPDFNCKVDNKLNLSLLNEIRRINKSQILLLKKDLKGYEMVLNYSPQSKEIRMIILNEK